MKVPADQYTGRFVDRLGEIMQRRRRQVGFRLAMMALMVVFFSRYLSVPAMCGWAVIYSSLQALEFFVLVPPQSTGTGVRAYRAASLATIALNSVVFGVPAPLWAHFGGLLGLLCGAYLLSGAILNTVLTTRDCKAAFIASITPFLVYVMIGAVLASGDQLKWDTVLTVGIAGGMMALSGITLWIDGSKTQRSEKAALLALEDREAMLEHALRQAQDASQAKSAFLANMSHELRTPLNGVLGMASVLARTGLDPAQAEMVQVVTASALNLQILLSDVLDLAKIEAAQFDLHMDVVTPAALARNVGALFAAAASEKGLTLALEIDQGAEAAVLADGARLSQILTNLCNNAIKFTEQGSVQLSVTTTEGAQSRRVAFSVTDTGIGLSQDGAAHLFERFAQADASITRRFGGTGLGLAISKHLADLMGGEISVQSEEGRGATFTATFDFAAAPSMTALQTTEAAPPRGSHASPQIPLRVLLVEDHPVNRKVVQLILSDFSDVDVAVNGAEGLEAAKLNAYDVILMDMQMPVMDGLTATRAIRRWESEQGLSQTPVVMLTANAMDEHIAQSLAAGANRHLPKPITAETLLEILDAVLDGPGAEFAANDLNEPVKVAAI